MHVNFKIDSRLRQQCSKLYNIVVGVLSLAPCYVGKILAQVRRDDQSRYHNLKPPSSLGSGWNEIHCPLQISENQSEVLHLFRWYTHTHLACSEVGFLEELRWRNRQDTSESEPVIT